MPLPMMAGDPATMLSQPGMQPPPGLPPGGGTGVPTPSPVDPREQTRGAIELISQLKTQVAGQLETLAMQFPSVSNSANQVVQAFNTALQGLVRDIVQTTQSPEPEAPRFVR